ncbi:MAG: hypothetical protein K0U69_01645, partial [Actinomycetia bacterium]|nr:hypothetical protein [Actinomycetes bacterium]
NDAAKVLLKTEMHAGHGGISGRYERWKEAAFQYAWLLDAAGLDAAGLDAAGLDAAGLDAAGLDAAGLDTRAAHTD